jgi:hypothetical protein
MPYSKSPAALKTLVDHPNYLRVLQRDLDRSID